MIVRNIVCVIAFFSVFGCKRNTSIEGDELAVRTIETATWTRQVHYPSEEIHLDDGRQIIPAVPAEFSMQVISGGFVKIPEFAHFNGSHFVPVAENLGGGYSANEGCYYLRLHFSDDTAFLFVRARDYDHGGGKSPVLLALFTTALK
jgi:hypothetical protein